MIPLLSWSGGIKIESLMMKIDNDDDGDYDGGDDGVRGEGGG